MDIVQVSGRADRYVIDSFASALELVDVTAELLEFHEDVRLRKIARQRRQWSR